MNEYVVGFLFDPTTERVVLVRKNRPKWQLGRYNGVGGRVEVGESVLDTMRREFKEETGFEVDSWQRFCALTDKRGWKVYFFFAIDDVNKCVTTTDERIEVVAVAALPHEVIPNLRWLIPMALSMGDEECLEFEVHEIAVE